MGGLRDAEVDEREGTVFDAAPGDRGCCDAEAPGLETPSPPTDAAEKGNCGELVDAYAGPAEVGESGVSGG